MPSPRADRSRTKAGCLTCRKRHAKCDKTKPACKNCTRLKIHCDGYGPSIIFRDDTEAVSRRVAAIEAEKWAAIRARDGRRRPHRSEPEAGPEPSVDGDSAGLRPVSSASVETRIQSAFQDLSPSLFRVAASEYGNPLSSDNGHGQFLSHASSSSSSFSSAADADPGAGADAGADADADPDADPDAARSDGDQAYDVGEMPSHSGSYDESITFLGPTPPRTESVTDHLVPATSTSTSTSTSSSLAIWRRYPDDASLSNNFPTQLPSVFQDIWEGAGYSNAVLRSALLAMVPRLETETDEDLRITRLQYYSHALNAMAQNCSACTNVTQAGVRLAIFCLFLLIEVRFGTTTGGVTHSKQADLLVLDYGEQLIRWQTGQCLLGVWIAIKCTYSSHELPWADSAETLQLLTGITSRRLDFAPRLLSGSQMLLPLLLESDRLNQQITLGRLLGADARWPSFRSWCRGLATLGISPPEQAIYSPGRQEERLAAIAAHLDAWHGRIDTADLPTCGIVSHRALEATAGVLLSGVLEPLHFRSHRAAMTYLHYVAAQEFCSSRHLDHKTGGDLSWTGYDNRWITLMLRIVSSIDIDACSHEDLTQMGVLWVIGRILSNHYLNTASLDALERLMPRVHRISDKAGLPFPARLFGEMLARHRQQRRQGRVILHSFANFGPLDEAWKLREPRIEMRVMLLGRLLESGDTWYELDDVVC